MMNARGRGGGLPSPPWDPQPGRGEADSREFKRQRVDECISRWVGREAMCEIARKRPREGDSDEEVLQVRLPEGMRSVAESLESVEVVGGDVLQAVGESRADGNAEGSLPVGEWKIISWNVSGLSEAKMERISGLGGDLWAVQETHLPQIELLRRKGQAARLKWRLIHGKPVPVSTSGAGGRARGVGSLAAPGVAVREVMPAGRAWKKLWEAQRVPMVEFPPREGLPKSGERVCTCYGMVRGAGRYRTCVVPRAVYGGDHSLGLGYSDRVHWRLEQHHQAGQRL